MIWDFKQANKTCHHINSVEIKLKKETIKKHINISLNIKERKEIYNQPCVQAH